MSREYSELVGGLGRAVNFRPARYRVKELLHLHPPELTIDGEPRRLRDFSMNGLSFSESAAGDGTTSQRFPMGTTVEIALKMSGRDVYRGMGEVVRVDVSRSATHVGVGLNEGFIDVPKLVDMHEIAALAGELEGGAQRIHDRVPADYRAVIGEMVHFFQFYRLSLERHEAVVRNRGTERITHADTMPESAFEALQPAWAELRQKAIAATLPHMGDVATIRAMKRYTETMLTTLLLDAPLVRRAYQKPLGYPGDYETMLQIYRNAYEGETGFGRLVHKLFAEDPLAYGGRGRKQLIKDLLRREHQRFAARRDGASPFTVTSLACGPSMEVVEFLSELGGWAGEMRWTLIDQEEAALSWSYDNVFQAMKRARGQASLQCLYLSFVDMVSDSEFMKRFGAQQLIYSAGLFDYLRRGQAQELIEVLASYLAPGGLLAIGNALMPNPNVWACEFVLDWSLLYRTREEVLDLAKRIEGICDVEIVADPFEVFFMLLARRRE